MPLYFYMKLAIIISCSIRASFALLARCSDNDLASWTIRAEGDFSKNMLYPGITGIKKKRYLFSISVLSDWTFMQMKNETSIKSFPSLNLVSV